MAKKSEINEKTLAKAALAATLAMGSPAKGKDPEPPKTEITIPNSDNTTARVIYAESGPAASTLERMYIASVIKNRIGHKAFGNKKSMNGVVTARGQFSALNDKRNMNWGRSGNPSKMDDQERNHHDEKEGDDLLDDAPADER